MPPDGPASPSINGKTATHGMRRTNWFGAFLGLCVLTACAVSIYFLSADARREINKLATANADSTQWALAQSEVELLALLAEAHASTGDSTGQVAKVRRRFDVLYSRVSTMQESAVLAGLREEAVADAALNDVAERLDALIPIIDGPDTELIAFLPEFAQEIEDLRPQIRQVSLLGVEHFSRLSDEQRVRVMNALIRLGALTFLLVAALSVAVLALIRSFRRATLDARERAAAEQRMGVIVSTSLDAVVVVDLNGRVVEFNEAAEKIFGYSRDEILNQQMSDKIIPEKYHSAHEAGMTRYIETREKHVIGQGRVQLEARHKSGRIFPVELALSNATGPDGEIFVAYLRDISNRVAKQEELVKARDEAVAGEKAKAELVAVMSHEMRTPLNGIIGALELLKDTKLTKAQSHMADVMDTSANMLLQHVNDVLDISRLEADTADLIKEPFNPVQVAEEILGSLRVAAENRGNALSLMALDPAFDVVLGDPSKLRQILTNLVGNAIKFTHGGNIVVEIEPDRSAGQWELRVTDDGIGMSDDDLSRIFDDFVTLDTSYSRAQEGTGLGLAIVRRLVAHLGGEMGVESEIGAGSVFWVRLPTHANDEAAVQPVVSFKSPKAAPEKPAPKPLSVLLVEDNEINRVVAGEFLKKLGHQYVEAHHGDQAVAMAEQQTFDAILMDISMPGMDGVEAAHHITSGDGPNAQTPIYAVTAHAMRTDIDRFKSAGMTDVLVKPISLDRLAALLGSDDEDDTPPEMAELGHWDHTVLDELRSALGDEHVQTLMTKFDDEMTVACQTVFHPAEHPQADQLRAAAHKLAGSASIVGARRLRELLNNIELHILNDETDKAETARLQVAACWQISKDAPDSLYTVAEHGKVT